MPHTHLLEALADQPQAGPVKHAGPYADVPVPAASGLLSEKDIQKWVLPFYLFGISDANKFAEAYKPIRGGVDMPLITTLLTEDNWRPRLAGAYIAAVESMQDACEHIGRLLLRSDVCYAGTGYALALTAFNSPPAVIFLKQYLEHYLQKRNLAFDQPYVMAALLYSDRVNGTRLADEVMPLWRKYARTELPSEGFARDMEAIDLIREAIAR